jgi:predicted transcriptional regulator
MAFPSSCRTPEQFHRLVGGRRRHNAARQRLMQARQVYAVRLKAQGYTGVMIAEQLGVSPATVSRYLARQLGSASTPDVFFERLQATAERPGCTIKDVLALLMQWGLTQYVARGQPSPAPVSGLPRESQPPAPPQAIQPQRGGPCPRCGAGRLLWEAPGRLLCPHCVWRGDTAGSHVLSSCT